MVKNPSDQCEALAGYLKGMMVKSRQLAFTDLTEGKSSLKREILFWQDFNPTYMIVIDYTDYAEKGVFKAHVSRIIVDSEGKMVEGGTAVMPEADYQKKKEFLSAFDQWLKNNIRPRQALALNY